MNNKITIVRTHKCRKSDVIIRFLEENNIPHEVKFVETDPEAQKIFKIFNIKASPGIVINGQAVNPYHLIEHCKVKDPVNTKKMFYQLLKQAETN